MYGALTLYTCSALTGGFSSVPCSFVEVFCPSGGHVVLCNPVPSNNWPLFTANLDDPPKHK